MKRIVLTLIGLLVIILELTLSNKFKILGTNLNLLFVYAIALALNVDTKTDYTCIVILGFVYDLLISRYFGVNLIILLALTALARVLIDKLYEEKLWSVVVILIISSAIFFTYQFLVNQILYVPQEIAFFPRLLWRNVLSNTVAGVLLNAMLRPISKHIMKNWW